MAHARDVARYILNELAPADSGRAITAWKLQKLVYYSQAWSLVWDDQPLFGEQIEAWANGPVCRDLYELHRGRFKLNANDIEGDPDSLTENQRDTIDRVIQHYQAYSAHHLSELSHSELPWQNAREGLAPGDRGENPIPWDSMAEFYGGL